MHVCVRFMAYSCIKKQFGQGNQIFAHWLRLFIHIRKDIYLSLCLSFFCFVSPAHIIMCVLREADEDIERQLRMRMCVCVGVCMCVFLFSFS